MISSQRFTARVKALVFVEQKQSLFWKDRGGNTPHRSFTLLLHFIQATVCSLLGIVRRFWAYIRIIELIDSPSTFAGSSTVYIPKNIRKIVMSVNRHCIIRFWFLLASTTKF
jgi:hypothetical protein